MYVLRHSISLVLHWLIHVGGLWHVRVFNPKPGPVNGVGGGSMDCDPVDAGEIAKNAVG